MGPGHQVVQHDVDPQPRRHAVGGRVAEVGGREVVVGHLRQGRFHRYLGHRVGGHRVERSGLVEGRLPRRPVGRAGGREEEPAHPGLLSDLGQADGGHRVDLVREVGVDVAERVVRQPGEMEDGFDPLEVGDRDIAQIAADRGGRNHGIVTESLLLEPTTIESDHVVSRAL